MTTPKEGTPNLLRQMVNRTADLAPLKPVATRAIQMAQDENTAAMDLATVLSSDQALTSRLLKLSNSAYYGYARRISNVREAVILLGMKTVRAVAISSSVIEAFQVPNLPGYKTDLLWAHSVLVGLVAEQIARDGRSVSPEDAFTAGVLHDVGQLAMLLCEPGRFEVMVNLRLEGAPHREAEAEAFDGVSHAIVGARLAQRWKFPDGLVDAIRDHHQSNLPDELRTLTDIVATANLACNRDGYAAGFDWTRDRERQTRDVLPRSAEKAINAVHGGMETLQKKAQMFLANVTARPPAWYAPVAQAAEGEPMRGNDNIDGAAA